MGAGLDRGDWPRPSVGAGPCRCRAPSGGAELIKREPFYTMDDVIVLLLVGGCPRQRRDHVHRGNR